jgi:hypothetical protein
MTLRHDAEFIQKQAIRIGALIIKVGTSKDLRGT